MSATPLSRLPPADGGIDDIAVGDFVSFERQLDERVVDAYAKLMLDRGPLRFDVAYDNGIRRERCVVHDMLLISHFSSAVGLLLPGNRALLTSIESDFPQPVFVGDTVTFSVRVAHIDRARFLLRLVCLVLRGHEVCSRSSAVVEIRQ